jgi:uncharacterized protein YyaL (SSP411 family)
MTNHLANERSPYLLQHADNPVDWYPWSDEALEKARQEDKPIFLSIGYAACHWCHVMAHESFEDRATAALMNANFVCIKVDREERPDLDSIYMDFVVASTGSGGWPMSVFLTPLGKPIYGGTYFPSYRSHNLPSFTEVLSTVARLWRTDRAGILSSSEKLAQSLVAQHEPATSTEALEPDVFQHFNKAIAEYYDWQNGGWGAAPKFPQPMLIEYLLRQASRGDQPCLDIARHALNSMAQGGMYDLLGGGFARYSVDATWLVPHFEKMLYDNAQLGRVYLHAYQLTGEPAFRETCEATLDFVLREMTHPLGGFFSSLDADSEGEEGKYYLWTAREIRQQLAEPGEAELFMAAYGMSEPGNFNGRNILRCSLTAEQLAEKFHLDANSLPARLASLREKLLRIRNTRVRPGCDDKVLVAWNSLALAAFAESGRALSRPDYLQAANRNADFILTNMLEQGRLLRSWREGSAHLTAYLEDYAALGLALLTLYRSDPNPRWYQASLGLLGQVIAHFSDPFGGFYDTSDDHEALLYRPKDLQDNATPSGNGLAALLLLKLSAYEGRPDWRRMAEGMLSANLGMMQRYPAGFAQWLCTADVALGPLHEVAIVGDQADAQTQALLQPLWQGYHPRLVLAAASFPPPDGSAALLQDRPLLNGKPTAYVCQGFVCQQPVNEPQAMLQQLPASIP